MLNLGIISEDDYGKYEDIINFVNRELDGGGDYYNFEYKGRKGVLYIKGDDWSVFFSSNYEDDYDWKVLSYNADEDAVYVSDDEGTFCYREDSTSLICESGFNMSFLCAKGDGKVETINFVQYNPASDESVLMSYNHAVTEEKKQYIYEGRLSTPFEVMYRKQAKSKEGLEYMPDNADLYELDDSGYIYLRVKSLDKKEGSEYYSFPFFHKSILGMAKFLMNKGFVIEVPKELLVAYNQRISYFDFLAFAREIAKKTRGTAFVKKGLVVESDN